MSLVDQVRKLEQQVVDRMKELEPLTREYDQLRKVAERLGLKYTPGSAKSDDGASPSAPQRRTAKPAPAAKRPARKPAKPQAAQTRGRSAAKPSATPRTTRSTTAPTAKASAQASRGSGSATRERQRKRTAASAERSGGRRAAARPGQRHDDVLRLVSEKPGITVREIGERLGVDATGLYRVVKRLEDEGRVRKDGVRLQPVDAPTASRPKPDATGGTVKQTSAAAGTETHQATRSSDSEPSTAAGARAASGKS
jgi:Winged helix-turn-helix DNA-binding